MATVIEQTPLYEHLMPVGQEIMFTISNNTIVNNNFNVKFCAAVHISNEPIVLTNDTALIGTFKTSPNAAGVGMFDLRTVVETFLKADNEPNANYVNSKPRYKDDQAQARMFPIHLVDKVSMSTNSCKYLGVNFYVEYSTTPLGLMTSEINNPRPTVEFTIFNGVVRHNDPLTVLNLGGVKQGLIIGDDVDDFTGYNFITNDISGQANPAHFLSNAPTTQYATLNDYGALAMTNNIINQTPIAQFRTNFYNSAGVQLGATEVSENTAFYGGVPYNNLDAAGKIIYVGAFPANFKNWSTIYAAAEPTLSYYTIQAYDATGTQISQLYTINILCPNLKGYEPIRLAWLNRWGAWDYYTFNMKSSKTINSKKIPFNQEAGTWNESVYRSAGYKGGKKNFRVNSTERIRINTDFVTEAEGVWFQQLINSTEVYIVKGFQTEVALASQLNITNKYIQPAIVTTSSYTTKTIANDKLMQYTFEIEKSKMERTQTA